MSNTKFPRMANDIIAVIALTASILGLIDLIHVEINDRHLPLWLTLTIFFLLSLLLILMRNKIRVIEKIILFFTNWLITPLLISPLYLVFGSIANRRLLKEIHRTSIALQESNLFGRLAELRNPRIKNYHIIYTHKDGHPPIGNLENYRIAGFPVDESQMIMRLWYFVTNNLYLDWSRINPVCSCISERKTYKEKVYEGSFSIIGSPKGNQVCCDFMDILSSLDKEYICKRDRRYMMKLNGGNDGYCYIEENETQLLPDRINPHAPPAPDEILKDYGLIMKLPNILNNIDAHEGHTIFLFAGCKVGGQCGITEWFFTPENLSKLSVEYNSKYFQILLEVRYKYVPQANPKIEEIEILHQEEIKIDEEMRLSCKKYH